MYSRSLLALVVLLLTFSSAAIGGERKVGHYNLDKAHLAIQGYDPVAYFKEGGGAPRKGKASLQVEFDGAIYRFATKKNRDAFASNPERFEPRYGGWCAWAMFGGDKVEVDPESFLIEEGNLHLFYDSWIADTRKKWLKKGGTTVRPGADKNWTKLSGEGVKLLPKLTEGLAGFDPLSFNEGSTPELGESAITTIFGGVRYQFKSTQNRDKFLASPVRYAPSYGGNAAFELASGKVAAGVPQFFLVQEQTLFLFASEANRSAWLADAKHRAAADKQWSNLQSKDS